MICRNCGADVRPDRFCSNCGASMNVQYCSYCGSAVAAGSSRCPSCGRPVTSAPAQSGYRAPAPQPPYVGSGVIDDYDRPVYGAPTKSGLKARDKKAKADGTHRTGFMTFVCLICGIVGLGALGYVVYNLLMGSLFTVPDGGVYPLPATGEAFGIIPNFQGYIDSYISLYDTIVGIVQSGAEPMTIVASMIALVPAALFLSSVPLAALMTCIATIVAVFRFIGGMCSGKYFTLVAPLGWAVSGLLFILLSSAFAGLSGYVTATSGLTLCLILCTAAIGVCVIGNVFFAGKRFFRGGSMMKFLTNGGILAGAIISALSLPLMFFNVDGVAGLNLSLAGVCGMLAAGELTMPQFVLYAIILLMMFKCVFSLPAFVRKTSTRLGKTFKFDGYEDSGFIRKSFVYLIGLLILTVPVFVLSYGGFAEGAVIADSVYVFIAGGVITFVSAILNRIFLNSDQK